MKFSLLLAVFSLLPFFSGSYADKEYVEDHHQRASQGVIDALEIALIIAQLYSYELRARSIEIPVALDMITAISTDASPRMAELPGKYRKLFNNAHFKKWQKRMRNISGSIVIIKPSKNGEPTVTTYWKFVLEKFNRQSPKQYYPDKNFSSKEALMKLNDELRPVYAGILGNVQILKYAQHGPVHIDDYRAALHSLQHAKSVLEYFEHNSSKTLTLLLDFARFTIERLEREIEDMISHSPDYTELSSSDSPRPSPDYIEVSSSMKKKK